MTTEIKLQIQRFRIEGLFNRHTLEIILKDNKLIIVGENGSGKSTIMNMLYSLLTCQWLKLRKAPFSRLELELGGEILEVDKEKLNATFVNPQARRQLQADLRLRMSDRQVEMLLEELDGLDSDNIDYNERIMFLARRTGLSTDHLMEIAWKQATTTSEESNGYIESLSSSIKSNVNCQVLFLPTYRRIERDLQALFPNILMEREPRRWHKPRNSNRNDLELVEFGMRDVDAAFRETTQRLDREFRSDLNNLTGEYLKDIIRSEYKSTVAESFFPESVPVIVNNILGRMDDRILPRKERNELTSLIETVQREAAIQEEQKVVLHFVSKLIQIHEKQRKREERVTKLVEVCNRYLTDKSLQFDSQQFALSLARGKEPDQDAETINTSDLSSGEKQIVSLFTHIYLSDVAGYFVMIDEPELSISVPWQRTFLEDIVKSGLCHGLVAVTHSPFIFENSLNDYARSMTEFLQKGGTTDVIP